MDLQEQLLNLEYQFWNGDAEFYRRNLTDDAVMVFAEPVGMLSRDAAIEGLAGSARWTNVSFEDVRLLQLTREAIVLAYKASAQRGGDGLRYSALASSAYVSRGGSWKLAFHQQTPGRGT